MKVKVDQDKCIGCGLCVSLAEEVFVLNEEGKSDVKGECFEEECWERVKEAVSSCPVGAISLVEEENK